MKTVPRDCLEETRNRLCELDQAASDKMAKQFFELQPALGIYCAAQQENLDDEAGDSPMIELTITFWQAMTEHVGHPLRMATPEEIEAIEDKTINQLQRLEAGSEADLQSHALGTIHDHNQREMLRFGIEVLFARHEDEPDLAPDSLGMEMIWLKTVVEVLDKLAPDQP
jgi:hypothetical protein